MAAVTSPSAVDAISDAAPDASAGAPSNADGIADADARRPSRVVGDWRWTVLAGATVTIVRWIYAADRRVIHVVPDESAQLAMARWLGGGTRWNMFDHITWRPGYAVVVAPLWRLTGDGEAFVRATLTLNAIIAGLSAIVLARLLRRWTELAPLTCAAIAGAVALAPAAISSSAYTWAETLVTLTFLGTVWATQRTIDTGRTRDAIMAVVVAAGAMTVHGRSLTLLPAAALVCIVVLVVHRRWIGATTTATLAVVTGTASLAFTRWVLGNVWDEAADSNTAGSVIERLDAPVALAQSLAGQTWYQLVASLGLVGIGAGMVLAALVRPSGRVDRSAAIVLTVLTAPLILTSVTFMSGRDRPDQLVYGRYVDAVAWPLVALGAAWVARRLSLPRADRRPPLLALGVAALTLLTGLIVAFRSGDVLASDVGLRMMVPGLLPYIGGADGVPVLRITLVATLAIGAIALAARTAPMRRRAVPAALALMAASAVLLGWSAVRIHDAQAHSLNSWAIGAEAAEIDALVGPGEPIGIVFARDANEELLDQRIRYQLYQLYLPDHPFVWERHRSALQQRFVLGPSVWRPFTESGYEIRWRDPDKRIALWEFQFVPGTN